MSEIKDTNDQEPEQTPLLQATEPIAAEEIAPPITAGQMLREARAASGMHIGTLSLALKVPVKKLEALESDNWAQLPDAVFVRALATSMCRQIKTDSAPILAALPQSRIFQGIDQGSKITIQPSFHTPADSAWRKLNLRLSLPMLAGAVALLLAAVLLIFLPDFAQQQNSKKTEIIEKIEPIVPPEPMVIPPILVASAPAIAQAEAPLLGPTSPAVVAMPLLAAAPTPVVPPVAASPAKLAASAPAPAVTLTEGASILRMVAKGEVWVEVKDSKGAVLVQRTMQPKEVINAYGSPPLAVVVGRINEMQSVEVRGKPFNLGGLSPDNVARFEVK